MKHKKAFSGRLAFLSNFHPAAVSVPRFSNDKARDFVTVEHAYQASKTPMVMDFLDEVQMTLAQYNTLTPGKAKQLGREVTLRHNWNRFVCLSWKLCCARSSGPTPSWVTCCLTQVVWS